MMRRLFISLVVSVVMLSCADDSPSYPTYSGIASVEVADTAWFLHFYSYSFSMPMSEMPEGLGEGSRVQFKVRPQRCLIESDTMTLYTAKIISISEELLRPIMRSDSVVGALGDVKDTAVCVPVDMHITRDFRHRDYFNVTSYYGTHAGNADYTSFVYDPSEQVGRRDSVVVLWLRHYQTRTDSVDYIEYDTFSTNLNGLIPSAESERIMIRVKRLGMERDTVVDDFVYSFRNK